MQLSDANISEEILLYQHLHLKINAGCVTHLYVPVLWHLAQSHTLIKK